MTDSDFLSYCLGMADTPRCGFAPMHIARLLKLSGNSGAAEYWDKQPPSVINADRHDVRDLVKAARTLLKEQKA